MLQKFRGNRQAVCLSMFSLYMLIWGSQYIVYNYLPIYIDSLPFATNTTTGFAVALGSAVIMVSQPFWGAMADRAKTKNMVLGIGLLCSAGFIFLFLIEQQSTAMLFLCVAAFYFFFLAPQTVVDTISLENLDALGVPYSRFRAGGSCGSALTALCLSFFPGISSSTVFLVFALMLLLSLLPFALAPKTAGHQYKADQTAGDTAPVKKASFIDLLKNKKLMLIISFVFLGFISNSFMTTFFPVYYATERGLNAGTGMLSTFMFIAIIIEAVLMLFSHRTFDHFHVYTVLLMAPAGAILRCICLYFIDNPYLLLPTTFLQMLCYAPYFVAVVPLINRIVPDELKASGQSLWAIAAFGLSPVFGNIAGGAISDLLGGIRNAFGVLIFYNLILFLVYFFLFARQKKRDQALEQSQTSSAVD